MREFHNCDNMDLLASYQDNQLDLGYDDPPWGKGEHGGKDRTGIVVQRNGRIDRVRGGKYVKKDWDKAPPPPEWFHHYRRITRNQIIKGGNYFPELVGTPFRSPRREEFEQFLEDLPRGFIIWDKVNGNCDQYDCEVFWTSFDRPSWILTYMWNGMNQGRSIARGNVMQGDKRLNEKRLHPCHTPQRVVTHILKQYTEPGQSVLDSHAGHNPTAVACEQLGLDYVTIERDSDYFRSGGQYIIQSRQQQRLFT